MKIKLSVFAIFVLLLAAVNLPAQSKDKASLPNQTPVKKDETDAEKSNQKKEEWTKTWSVVVTYNTTFNTNLEHDETAKKAFGFVPSVTAGYQLRSKRHRLRLIYGFGAARYTTKTDLNRFGQYLGGAYRLSFGKWSLETEGEAVLKGTNEDRETGNQFIFTEKLGYRFDDKTRATIYYAYRIKRFDGDEAERNAVNPMYGFKFERQFGSKFQLELGYRYDENRAQTPRQNYVRSTYDTSLQYRLTKKDLLSVDARFRPRLYQRTVEVGNLEVPRRDRKYNLDFGWRRDVTRRFGFEFTYGFEKQNSNDVDKIYRDHQAGFSVFYHWGNGDEIVP
jgi:Putative MetA-pathway of phenol degradation